MTAHANWRDDAACRDADPDLFFPVSTTGSALRQIDEAKRICRACPAQGQCLAWALDQPITDGVWGRHHGGRAALYPKPMEKNDNEPGRRG